MKLLRNFKVLSGRGGEGGLQGVCESRLGTLKALEAGFMWCFGEEEKGLLHKIWKLGSLWWAGHAAAAILETN